MRELYWVAIYLNDSQLLQFENGVENKYADIDRERLIRFDLVDKATNRVVHSVYLNEGKQLIYRRRTFKQAGKPDIVVYLAGWRMTVMTNAGPKSIVVINYLHPDGSVALDGSRRNLELLDIER